MAFPRTIFLLALATACSSKEAPTKKEAAPAKRTTTKALCEHVAKISPRTTTDDCKRSIKMARDAASPAEFSTFADCVYASTRAMEVASCHQPLARREGAPAPAPSHHNPRQPAMGADLGDDDVDALFESLASAGDDGVRAELRLLQRDWTQALAEAANASSDMERGIAAAHKDKVKGELALLRARVASPGASPH